MTRLHTLSLTAVVLAAVLMNTAVAQTVPYTPALTAIGQIRRHFTTDAGKYVSCQVKYYYSLASDPSHYLDSLSGTYRLSPGKRYTRIGHTETIQEDSMMVMVFNDDKVLMAGPSAPGNTAGKDLFLDNLDSAFLDGRVASVTMSPQKGSAGSLTLQFKDPSRYFNCTIVYDTNTYIPRSLSYTLPASKATGRSQAVLVIMLFSGYNNDVFDAAALGVDAYIKREADGKIAARPSYAQYRVMQTADSPVRLN